MTKPVAKADIRKRFARQLNALSAGAKAAAEAAVAGGQVKQPALDKNGWEGNVFDIPSMSKPFDRQEHTDDAAKAVSDPKSPGTVGDLTIGAKQGDWLAAQERSFRLKHSTRIRRKAHAAARKYGHGHAGGVLQRGVMNDLQQILERSKEVT